MFCQILDDCVSIADHQRIVRVVDHLRDVSACCCTCRQRGDTMGDSISAPRRNPMVVHRKRRGKRRQLFLLNADGGGGAFGAPGK